jgi:hypothetical protein
MDFHRGQCLAEEHAGTQAVVMEMNAPLLKGKTP